MKKILSTLIAIFVVASSYAEVLGIDSCRSIALRYNKERQMAALTTRQAIFTQKSTYAMFFPDFSLMGFGLYDTGKGTTTLDFNSALSAMMQPYASTIAQVYQMMAQQGINLPQNVTLPSFDMKYKLGFIYSGGVVLKQPLYMGGKIRAGYHMSQTAVEMARQNERLTDAQVIQQTDEAYAKVVQAQELVKVASSYKDLLSELEKNVESAVRHGLKLENDRMKVQVKINEVELQLRRAENGVRLARMNLCHQLGRPLSDSLQIVSSYPEVEDVQALQSGDISARPEVALLEYQTSLAQDQIKIARSAMLPSVALLAKYGYTHGLEFNDRTLLHGWNFAGGVTVSVPLYHFGEHTNKLKAAKAKYEQTCLEKDNKSEMMLLELNQAANNFDESQLEVSLAETSLEQAATNMKLSKQQYEAGMETLSDYLESQALWQKAYESKVNAHFQLYLSSVNYLRAAGRLVE